MKKMIATTTLALGLVGSVCAAQGAGVRVQDPWLRATPPGATVAGGFLTLINDGSQPDRLVRVESPLAARVELHETRAEGGAMRMRALPDGLTVPAHGQVVLKPGSYHLMFIQPTQTLTAGMQVQATLVFERAGQVPVTFVVRPMGAR
ncbi:MAG: copper chaperone PCu(A)C [Thermomonas hydrothermalis]|uniref:copper chaperone PCu(A)C n=1 Tax=Thermomonas hydrothermalis TaxID=213588 RepID=UPI0023533475|nr:copper chaperone PCu(A)C [Thermomonas hydrothermalis]MCL6618202.1 copper chaperone PCu(A)C [Thermomonas hydrothermalis]